MWAPDGRSLYFLSNRAGSMNMWRVAIDEASGRTTGEPQPLTAPASYVAHFTLSADGRTGAYAAFVGGGNVAILAVPGENLATARLAANDSQLFFIHSSFDSDIWLVRFDGDEGKGRAR